jgi:hypothetical protein
VLEDVRDELFLIAQTKFVENVFDVGAHGAFADEELRADLSGCAAGNQAKDFTLTA